MKASLTRGLGQLVVAGLIALSGAQLNAQSVPYSTPLLPFKASSLPRFPAPYSTQSNVPPALKIHQNVPPTSTAKIPIISQKENGWKGFFDSRVEYNLSHRLTVRRTLDMLSESEQKRLPFSEIAASRIGGAVRKSAEQTLREELQERMTIDDWTELHIVEPVEEFIEDEIVDPVIAAVTFPIRKIKYFWSQRYGSSYFLADPPRARSRTRSHNGLVQDILTGREEKNQLADPLNDEGTPGEEHYQPSRLPSKIAIGARPFQKKPYGYGTLRIGEWYTHGRLSAAGIPFDPRLNEASLALQTVLDPYHVVFSLGGKKPFKNKREPEEYFGPYGFIGLSRIIVNGERKQGEIYVEGRLGKEHGVFVGLDISY